MKRTHYTTSELADGIISVAAVLTGVAIVVAIALLPAWLLMVLMAQFGVVKPLWVWWLAIAIAGFVLRSRVEVKTK